MSPTASSSLSLSSSKTQRFGPGHANDEKGPRVATDDQANDKIAQALLTKIGFDPDHINKNCSVKNRGGYWTVTPIFQFSQDGNLTMCRYLVSRGADCRKEGPGGWFPMYIAAANGHLEIVQFLYHDGGAQDDIRRLDKCGNSALHVALWNGHFHVAQWLILNEVLSARNYYGVIDDTIMRNNLYPTGYFFWKDDKRLPLLSWAQDAVTTHNNFNIFLKGTIILSAVFRRHPNNEYATRSKRMKLSPSSSLLIMLKGKSGILQLIAAYTGYSKANDLRIFRQLIILLPAFIEDTPFETLDGEWAYV